MHNTAIRKITGVSVRVGVMFALVLFLALPTAKGVIGAARTPAALQHLVEAQVLKQPLLFRGLYQDNVLHYDATGAMRDNSTSIGPVTLAGVDIQKVAVSEKELVLDGQRAALNFDTSMQEFARVPLNGRLVRVVIERDKTADIDGYQTTIYRIFSRGVDDELLNKLPDYWQGYFHPKLREKQIEKVTRLDELYLADSRAKLPVVIASTDARPTELARAFKYKKKVAIRMLVDATGMPTNLVICDPIGFGMDEAAIEAAKLFRFTPATFKGEPIAADVKVFIRFQVTSKTD
jgi:hypothetical protein